MDITEAEFQLIVACGDLQLRKRKPPDRHSIGASVGELFDEALDLTFAFASLRERGLLAADADLLTSAGLEIARKLRADSEQADFGEWLTRAAGSPTYAEYCRRVYGTELVQFNMADAEQIDALVAALGLGADDRLLDLGCGIGSVTEYLADRTGARVTGVDFAAAAIAHASERTRDRRDQLVFTERDLNALGLPARSFDAVCAIDTLYFADDLDRVIADVVALLPPGGRLAAFWSQKQKPEDAPDILDARGTRLASSLAKLGLAFETRDFSASEHAIWRRSLGAATELESAFAAEGNLEVWRKADAEARDLLRFYDSGAMRRYLYTVELPGV
jgi:SAM-dependent methyltransferase